MEGAGSKRSYIHRKKYLNDCVTHIKGVLEFIRLVRRDPGGPEDSQRQALVHAQSVEALCWSPHSHLSADSYQKIMAAKTQELCQIILLKSFNFPQFCRLAAIFPECNRPPRPVLPMPIIPQRPAPDAARDDDFPSPFEEINIEFPTLESQPNPFMAADDGQLNLGGLESPF
jgi:hypothetical protein